MRIFFCAASRDPADGCRTYRIIGPANALSLAGHTVRVNSAISSEGKTLDRGNWDVIVAQRIHHGAATTEFLRLAGLKNGPVMLLELDDLLTDVHPSNSASWSVYSRPPVKERIIQTIQAAHGVVCSTRDLAEEVESMGAQKTWVFENCVDESTIAPNRSSADGIVVGWGGGFSHKIDIQRASYGIKSALKRHPDAILHTVGADFSKMLLPLETKHRHTEWTKDVVEYVQTVGLFDIGLAPLYPNRFNRCKSHLKPLEYMSQGVVPIASDYGPYASFIQDGVTGFLARNDQEWKDRLSLLIQDGELRQKMSEEALAEAGRWTLQERISIYERILNEAITLRCS